MLASLRRDPAPQQRDQAAVQLAFKGWASSSAAQPALDELASFGAGAGLADCPHLGAVVTDMAAGRRLLDGLTGPVLRVLESHPLAQVPMRHQYSPGLGLMQLATAGRAALSLVVYEALHDARARVVESVCFAGGDRHEICIAGAAEARFFEITHESPDRAGLTFVRRELTEGVSISLAGPRHAKIVDRPRGRLVVLRLSRTDEQSAPAREYRIADGALLHRASGNRAESRDEMAMAVLGAMERSDAVPAILSRTANASDHLRWQGIRHALALGTGAGFAALSAVAHDGDDPLAGPAVRLRAQLLSQHPVLANVEG